MVLLPIRYQKTQAAAIELTSEAIRWHQTVADEPTNHPHHF